MPYESDAQRRYFNSPAGKAKIGAKTVAEFNKASKGMKLPERKGDGDEGAPPKTYKEHEVREKAEMGAGYQAHESGRSRIGQAHTFSGTKKAGQYRMSGHPNAHRIGGKKK